jgi:hypothetical protein
MMKLHHLPNRVLRAAAGLCLFVLLFGWTNAVQAAAFDGSPKGGPASTNDSDLNCSWTSTLNPNPALQMATCPWVVDGLNAQGFNASNGWTVTTGVHLNGTLVINSYYAWVTKQPTYNFGGTSWGGGGPFECYGGAVLSAQYTPGTNDPVNIRWMQAIRTDKPTGNGITNGYNAGGGYYEYLDNAGTTGTDPFHPSLPNGAADNTYFLDAPARGGDCPYSADWDAQLFVSTWDQANKKITIYDAGIWWGFDLVCIPEPSSLTFAAMTVTFTLVLRRRRNQTASGETLPRRRSRSVK